MPETYDFFFQGHKEEKTQGAGTAFTNGEQRDCRL